MKVQGLHHITMLTGDARKNLAFYGDLFDLRLVEKTANFVDAPEAYHLYFGDETPLVNPRTARREKVSA